MKREDSIVSPTLSPYTSVDLGARSLISGVDCNDPKISLILELFVPFFSRHFDVVHHHAFITLHIFVKTKLFGLKI
jgi:hypothetical protein